MGNEAYWMMNREELELFELDMERSYEDPSFEFDMINAELQQLAQGE